MHCFRNIEHLKINYDCVHDLTVTYPWDPFKPPKNFTLHFLVHFISLFCSIHEVFQEILKTKFYYLLQLYIYKIKASKHQGHIRLEGLQNIILQNH